MKCNDRASAWAVFRRQILVGLVVSVGIAVLPLLTHGVEISEQRWFRSAMGRMPFSRVTVIGQHIEAGRITVWGTQIKRRCLDNGWSASVERSGVWYRAWVDQVPEWSVRPLGDRPSDPDPQVWGPWVLRIVPPDPTPSRWRIYAHHDCPRGPQTNLFAEGKWEDAD